MNPFEQGPECVLSIDFCHWSNVTIPLSPTANLKLKKNGTINA
jgi:hypothetical protein